MELFHEVSQICSRTVTNKYSTSFSLGIRLLQKSIRPHIYAIYGFVRFADEIVDTFHDFDKRYLLKKFRQDTFEAINNRISLNPILNSFQKAVNEYRIDHILIEKFLESMEMDLNQSTHDEGSYSTYIYGSAEVVGLMCLKVFVNGNEHLYEELKESSCRLGAAFQKVNFLRDIKSDFEDRKRIYFPGFNFTTFDKDEKALLVKNIEEDMAIAFQGILRLPSSSRSGVYLAYLYFKCLLSKLKETPPERIRESRLRINNFYKGFLLLKVYYVKPIA